MEQLHIAIVYLTVVRREGKDNWTSPDLGYLEPKRKFFIYISYLHTNQNAVHKLKKYKTLDSGLYRTFSATN